MRYTRPPCLQVEFGDANRHITPPPSLAQGVVKLISTYNDFGHTNANLGYYLGRIVGELGSSVGLQNHQSPDDMANAFLSRHTGTLSCVFI